MHSTTRLDAKRSLANTIRIIELERRRVVADLAILIGTDDAREGAPVTIEVQTYPSGVNVERTTARQGSCVVATTIRIDGTFLTFWHYKLGRFAIAGVDRVVVAQRSITQDDGPTREVIVAKVIDCAAIDKERIESGCTFELQRAASFLHDVGLTSTVLLAQTAIENQGAAADIDRAAICAHQDRLRSGHVACSAQSGKIVEDDVTIDASKRSVSHTVLVGKHLRHEHTAIDVSATCIGISATDIDSS